MFTGNACKRGGKFVANFSFMRDTLLFTRTTGRRGAPSTTIRAQQAIKAQID